MSPEFRRALTDFAKGEGFVGQKGPLCVALVVTKHALEKGLPLDPSDLKVKKMGQVAGLGKSAVQTILKKHGITRVLASEGGRTSRGSLHNMEIYVVFLNRWHEKNNINLHEVEAFWIERVKDFFAGKPFKANVDHKNRISEFVGDLLMQAEKRQKQSSGTQYVGAVMQHLVGAKLALLLPHEKISHHSFSTKDSQLSRSGDFHVGDVIIHVTNRASESLIEKCKENVDAGFHPLIVTRSEKVSLAEGLAEAKGIENRIEIFGIEQFIASNIYEMGKFVYSTRRNAIKDLISVYNNIIDNFETDPSLKIES